MSAAHLAIDAVGAKHSGAATVLNAIVDAAVRHPDVCRVTAFCSPASQRTFRLPGHDKLESVDVPLGERGPTGRAAWQYVRLPALVRRAGADLLLCLSGGGVSPRRVPAVLLVQQSLPFCDEALAALAAGERARARLLGWNTWIAVRRSAAVAVQTPTMARWVGRRLRVDPERVRVFEPCATLPEATCGAPELETLRATSGARFLYVGNSSPYKNLGVLAAAMERLHARRVDARLFATIAHEHALALAPGVVPLGRLPMPVLREAYALATALVMPSLVETVGLPMVEAFQAGTPVVAADRPYAHDVGRDAALYFDPHDHASLARALAAVAGDGALRARLSSAGLEVARERAEARPYDALVTWLATLARGHGDERRTSAG